MLLAGPQCFTEERNETILQKAQTLSAWRGLFKQYKKLTLLPPAQIFPHGCCVLSQIKYVQFQGCLVVFQPLLGEVTVGLS